MRTAGVRVAVVVLMLGLAACGDSDDSDDTSASDSTTTTAVDHSTHEAPPPTVPGARRIAVTASSFEFSPARIEVAAGEIVNIALEAEDLEHDFVIDDLELHASATPDEPAEFGFRAEEPGELTFYCSVAGHREAGMEGTVVVSAA